MDALPRYLGRSKRSRCLNRAELLGRKQYSGRAGRLGYLNFSGRINEFNLNQKEDFQGDIIKIYSDRISDIPLDIISHIVGFLGKRETFFTIFSNKAWLNLLISEENSSVDSNTFFIKNRSEFSPDPNQRLLVNINLNFIRADLIYRHDVSMVDIKINSRSKMCWDIFPDIYNEYLQRHQPKIFRFRSKKIFVEIRKSACERFRYLFVICKTGFITKELMHEEMSHFNIFLEMRIDSTWYYCKGEITEECRSTGENFKEGDRDLSIINYYYGDVC